MPYDPITIFAGAKGLNTKTDPARLQNEDGLTFLPKAVNVDISQSARVSRRKGFVKKSDTTGHSLFYEYGPCLFVSGNSLCKLNSDFSVSELATLGMSDNRMRYVQTPVGDIYFGNESDKGVYKYNSDTVDVWTANFEELQDDIQELEELRSDYLDGKVEFDTYSEVTEELLHNTEVYFDNPLPPRHLEFYRGRLFITYENYLLWSYPWEFGKFNLSDNYLPFDSTISLLKRTINGLYVGTNTGVFFIAGMGPDEFSLTKTSNEKPIEHTDVRVNAEKVFSEGKGEVVFWTSQQGICFGGPDGEYQNFTRQFVDIPNSMYGTALIKENKYLSILTI